MDIHKIIEKRRSVRAYLDKPIPEDVLNRVLEAARLAPSANNRQERKFIIVKDKSQKEKLTQTATQDFLKQAPVIIAAVGATPDKIMTCDIPADPVDVTIAVDHITLAAVGEGLGTCWIGAFSQEKACQLLNIPKTHKIVILITLGYPADTPKEKDRKPLKDIICYDKFS